MPDTPRPLFHFTADHWINDPNGLIYHDGEYHLFYQYKHAKHWGHAVSRDLITWEHLPVALSPDEKGDIWSGSVVFDEANTSGLFPGDRGGLVAAFTHHKGTLQDQNIAYSVDRGRTWTWYSANPAVPNPGRADFRDPKVLWHAPSRRWAMLVSGGDRLLFYTSPDLLHWSPVGAFEGGRPFEGAIWECPDLFQVPLEDDPAHLRWVLQVSYLHPETFQKSGRRVSPGTVYFVGQFDGHTFTPDTPEPRYATHGPDDYAAITWYAAPDNRSVAMGWMNNWLYAYRFPTSPWEGQMTLARQQTLRLRGAALQLINRPVPEYDAMVAAGTTSVQALNGAVTLSPDHGHDLRITSIQPGEGRLRLRFGSQTELEISLSADRSRYAIDRVCKRPDVKPDFTRRTESPRRDPAASTALRVIIDRCSVELFADEGEIYMAANVLPALEGEAVTMEVANVTGEWRVFEVAAGAGASS